MKNLSDESTEARMIRLQSAVKYKGGALGTRIIKELGDYFKYINDQDNCILKKNALKRSNISNSLLALIYQTSVHALTII